MDLYSYKAINLVFILLLVLLFIYPILATKNTKIAIKCIHTKYTNKKCISCGLTRCFKLLVKGNFNEAKALNPLSISVFFFFLIQLFFRFFFFIALSFYKCNLDKMIKTDIFLSLFVFVICYQKLIYYYFKLLII